LALLKCLQSGLNQASWTWRPLHDVARVDLPDIVADVQRAGMVGLVHPDRLLVMIDGDIDGAAERGLDAGARPAAAGEVVDDDAAASGGAAADRGRWVKQTPVSLVSARGAL
jgi:hypothetical protein